MSMLHLIRRLRLELLIERRREKELNLSFALSLDLEVARIFTLVLPLTSDIIKHKFVYRKVLQFLPPRY